MSKRETNRPSSSCGDDALIVCADVPVVLPATSVCWTMLATRSTTRGDGLPGQNGAGWSDGFWLEEWYRIRLDSPSPGKSQDNA